MSIVDFSKYHEKFSKNPPRNQNKITFQHPCNAILAGTTGSGKTNFLENLLLDKQLKMTYDRVWLICPSIEEDAYLYLQDTFENLQTAYEKKIGRPLGYQLFTHISKPEEIPTPEQFDKDLQHLVIVDDFVDNKAINEKIHALCIKNRKCNASLIYLSQDYFEIPKLVRRQMRNGYCVLWNTASGKELTQYLQEFSLGMDKEEFKKTFEEATKKRYTPLMIDFKTRNPKMRFRAGFDRPLGPDLPEESTSDSERIVKELK